MGHLPHLAGPVEHTPETRPGASGFAPSRWHLQAPERSWHSDSSTLPGWSQQQPETSTPPGPILPPSLVTPPIATPVAELSERERDPGAASPAFFCRNQKAITKAGDAFWPSLSLHTCLPRSSDRPHCHLPGNRPVVLPTGLGILLRPLGEGSDGTKLPSSGQGGELRARTRARKGNDGDLTAFPQTDQRIEIGPMRLRPSTQTRSARGGLVIP